MYNPCSWGEPPHKRERFARILNDYWGEPERPHINGTAVRKQYTVLQSKRAKRFFLITYEPSEITSLANRTILEQKTFDDF